MLDRFAAHLRYRGRSTATIDRRLCTLHQLETHLAPRPLFDATTDDLETFLGRWDSPATRRAYRGDLRDFYSWAVDKHHTSHDPADGLDPVSEPATEAQPLPVDVLRALLDTPDPDTRRMIRIAAYSGLRVGEIAALCGRDVDHHKRIIRVGTGKGGHGRIVPLGPELAAELADVPTARLFPTANAESVSARIKRQLVRHGLPDAHPHHLRHSFATHAAVALEGDVFALAALLGHRSIATTQRYVRFWQPDADRLGGLYLDAA